MQRQEAISLEKSLGEEELKLINWKPLGGARQSLEFNDVGRVG